MELETVARDLVAAVAARDRNSAQAFLAEGVTLRLFTWEGDGAHAPRHFALDALAEAAGDWDPKSLELLTVSASGRSAAVQFRIQSTANAVPGDINAGMFLSFEGGLVQSLDLHLSHPLPSATRGSRLKAGVSPSELAAVVESLTYRWDMRTAFGSNTRMFRTPGEGRYWTSVAHPGANQLIGVRWPEEEADARIEETKAWFRERGLALHWTVGPYDEPRDLGRRLLEHGFLRAGDQALMLRFGLAHLGDIPENSAIQVVWLKERPDLWETSLQITATAFHWPPEQVENERDSWFADIASEPARPLIALLDGKPVATANLYLQGPVAYLGGASTLAEFRGQRIYSTLLRRRLEQARDDGFEVAMIHAEPMSRRIVSRYGFQTYAMFNVYGWMDPMDEEVIRKLVVDD